MQTEPPPRANFCETVNQWVVTNMHYCLNQPSMLTRIVSFGDLHIFGMKNLDWNFLLCVKEDDYEVCQVGDLRLLRGLRDRQGAGGGEGDEEGGQRYQSKEVDEW